MVGSDDGESLAFLLWCSCPDFGESETRKLLSEINVEGIVLGILFPDPDHGAR
jgi:hypothetical protein